MPFLRLPCGVRYLRDTIVSGAGENVSDFIGLDLKRLEDHGGRPVSADRLLTRAPHRGRIEMTCLLSTNFPDWEGSHLTIGAIEDGSRSRRPRLSATRRCHAERPPGSACGRRGGESWRAGDRHGEHGRIFRPARRGGGQLPDEFLCNLFDLDPLAFVEMLREQAGDLIKPPVTFEELLERLARVVPDFVVAVRHLSPRP